MQSSDLVPMRWPAEPGWHSPAALSLLDGTPINCLVLSAGQMGAEPLVTAARQRGLMLASIDKLPESITAPAETVWPGVKLGRQGDAEAGPTGPPWVDSNGWRCLLARAKSPGKPVWVLAEPSEEFNTSRGQPYAIAIADAAAHGGRWVVSLDTATRKGILEKDAASLERWSGITSALRFFEERKAWRDLHCAARFGVLSDFEGGNEFMAQEVLNLAPRRYLSCRVMVLSNTNAASFEGLNGVIWIGEKAPEGAVLGLLQKFVAAGGLLILPTAAAAMAAKLGAARRHKTGYSVYASGRGSLAVAPEEWADPYVVTSDAHLLLSRRHDVYRVFNSGATNVHCTNTPDGGAVMHVLNYTGRTTYNPMSVFIARPYQTAKWCSLGTAPTQTLPVERAAEGVEVHLPPFAAYSAVEFGGRA